MFIVSKYGMFCEGKRGYEEKRNSGEVILCFLSIWYGLMGVHGGRRADVTARKI